VHSATFVNCVFGLLCHHTQFSDMPSREELYASYFDRMGDLSPQEKVEKWVIQSVPMKCKSDSNYSIV
jgi:hypothetical protein